ncbi:alpha/beta fold hydrolase [Fulvivirgaceae bacterium PWU4]|uniref:Alpha/beta fold hydrolase n=1 Tax=Chryseosolibacter histidini TaxID=2782349 RepID=A0AAP2GQ63_9BACT|nr:type I polyketide synthase [Chryseosolibacter histidini]MBT1698182.1 alpha/beta fold hydrolase [Chryseosolibacter histidini]
MKSKKRISDLESCPGRDAIAIVGLSCRFPQGHTLAEFWELLRNGRDTITEIKDQRWDHDAYYHPDATVADKTQQRHASLLDNIHDFDPLFFGISPAEAYEMSPSQKLMLELVWEALENASIGIDQAKGGRTGVYIGNIWTDFERYRKMKNAAATSHSALGQSANIIANRVSFKYGFTGPSLVVDTGCSASLVALHLACQALRDGSIDMAVVGGVNHILDPDQYILLSKFGGLSSTGKCHTFSRHADGFVRGEGGGVVLLKRLPDAEKKGEKIWALVRGTAMNNNGYNVNLPATSVEGQKSVLADAYRFSSIAPKDVHYVEAHGTGTRLGDPTEATALGEFFCKGKRKQALHIGSVKTNIGHLEAAAGIAGLIKVVLAMQHRTLPPSLNCDEYNPGIDFEALRLQVQHTPGPWPAKKGETLKAGINSFGWGGTNAHTVVEEYRQPSYTPAAKHQTGMYCLPVSAQTEGALKAYVKRYADMLRAIPEQAVNDFCVAAALRKPSLSHRAFFSAKTKEELLNALEGFVPDADSSTVNSIPLQHHRVVMVFPGQGAQWIGMGRDLLAKEPVFRQAIEACDNAFKPHTGWSLVRLLTTTSEESRLSEIDVIQPALCAIQVALARLWMSWGIQPQALVGHSMGEVAAACISGAIDLHQAALIICTRSRLMKTVSGKGGTMAVTELSYERAEALLIHFPGLSIAASNSPKSTVLAGDQQSISEILQTLERQSLFCRQVNVDVASHSRQMDPLKKDLRKALTGIKPNATAIPFYSTVRNRKVEGKALNAGYWVDNLRNPVHFSSVVKQLMQDEHTIFIEVSPHPLLVVSLNECAAHEGRNIFSVATLFRDKPEQDSMYKNLGELFRHGFNIPWSTFYNTDNAPHLQLPAYPFQRERFELKGRAGKQVTDAKTGRRYPLLGKSIWVATQANTYFKETVLSLETYPYLADHLVNNDIVVPGAVYAEMMLEAAGEIQEGGISVLSNLRFVKPLILASEEAATVQLKMVRNNGSFSCQCFQKTADDAARITWQLLAEGELKIVSGLGHDDMADTGAETHDLAMSGQTYYDLLRSLGLAYGPYFQGLKELRTGSHPSTVSFSLAAHAHVQRSAERYKIHPTLLDTCLQPLFFKVLEGISADQSRSTFLTGIRELRLLKAFDPSEKVTGTVRLHNLKRDHGHGTTQVEADITVYTSAGDPLLILSGVQGKVLESGALKTNKKKLKDWLYQVNWKKLSHTPGTTSPVETRGTWLVLGDALGTSNILVNKMNKRGFHCIHATPGTAFTKHSPVSYTADFGNEADHRALLVDVFRREPVIEGIIHCTSINNEWQRDDITADVLESSQVDGSMSLLCMYRQLAALTIARAPKLIVITNGVEAVRDQDVPHPLHSPLRGMAKVLGNEATQYGVRCFDLSTCPGEAELDLVVDVIQAPPEGEDELAFRGSELYTSRLHKGVDAELTPSSKQFSSWGTYLVTGFGGIGLDFITWMAARGARHFALVNRSGKAGDAADIKLARLRHIGCNIEVFAADVASYDALKNVLHHIEDLMPPLAGVVHAAGVIHANTLANLTPAELSGILSPKMKGAWNLHLLTRHLTLDCFILFSSASTLIGLSGQGSYVAANRFLDTLAHYRRSMDLPAMAVNWGVISDAGMVAHDSALERYARAEGFEPVPMARALEAFDAIYRGGYAQVGVAKLNANIMAGYYAMLKERNYFRGLLERERENTLADTTFMDQLVSLNPQEQITMLEVLVIHELAAVIKTPAARINAAMTFKSLGVDSIMAVQLRNVFEKILNLKLPVGMFWTHPSIRAYAAFLQQGLADQASAMPLDRRQVSTSDWFVIAHPNPNASFRIFLFHDAGGDTCLYNGWDKLLGAEAEVIAVELPGRGKRINKNAYENLDHLIADLKPALAPLLDKPYAFFGHSMGALIAFEMARSIRRSGMDQPSRIFISSAPALSTYSRHDIDYDSLEKDLFRSKAADSHLKQSLQKLLKDDLRLLKHYRYVPEAPLTVPLVVVHGSDDPRVSQTQAERWEMETNADIEVIARPGGHRYIEHDSKFLTDLIRKEMDAVKNDTFSLHFETEATSV